jgi:hypothetical protein
MDGYFSHASHTINVTLPIDAVKGRWYGYLILKLMLYSTNNWITRGNNHERVGTLYRAIHGCGYSI